MDRPHAPPNRGDLEDLRWVCAEYTVLTGRTDLQPEHLTALNLEPPLISAYVQDKLFLLAAALRCGNVHNPRGFLLRALEHDWRPGSAPPSREDLAARLRALGVSKDMASRLVRTNVDPAIVR